MSFSKGVFFKKGLVPGERHILSKLKGASIYHIEITLSDDLKKIIGFQKILYTNTEGEKLNEIWFHQYPVIAGSDYKINAIYLNDQFASGNSKSNGLQTQILLNQPLMPGEQIRISMDFSSKLFRTQ